MSDINGKDPQQPAPFMAGKLTPVQAAINRLVKWRSVLAGWQLGTRPITDPECAAVRDQRELLLILRAEMNALLSLLVNSRIIKHSDFEKALEEAAELDSENLAQRFPGYRATDEGIAMDVQKAAETARRYNFKP